MSREENRTVLRFSPMFETGSVVLLFLPLFLLFLVLNGCAKIGSPQGGPVDTTPPFYVDSEPGDMSVHFDGQQIEIEFDEYIQLNNLNEELLVSPPFENRPVIRVRNKSLMIDLNNELTPNTTYTMNFGNSIVDNNAGNVLAGFEFVFSTGDYIDSLAVTGETTAAFNQQPPGADEDVYVMLYNNLNDSAPLLELPRYIGRVGQNGHFAINHVQVDTFRAIALKDMNHNLRYDPVADAIAFTDSLVVVSPSTVQDVHLITDTLSVADSTAGQGIMVQAVVLSLNYFYEENSKIYLNNKFRDKPEKIFFTFTRPLYDSVTIEPLNFSPLTDWFIPEFSADMDTITYWITDTLISNMESVELLVSFTTTDEADRYITRHDTVQLIYRNPEPASEGIRKPAASASVREKAFLGLSSNVTRTRILSLNGRVSITAEQPLAKLDTSLIRLKKTVDSLEQAVDYILLPDTAGIRRFFIGADWEGESQYGLLMLPGAVTDIYGLQNDSLQLHFSTQAADYYGNIRVNLQGNEFPVILQVLNDDEMVVRETYLRQPDIAEFLYMPPGNYSLKAIHDLNGNKKWDTGNYLRKIQPEKTYFYDIPDETRSSWDYEYTWQIAE